MNNKLTSTHWHVVKRYMSYAVGRERVTEEGTVWSNEQLNEEFISFTKAMEKVNELNSNTARISDITSEIVTYAKLIAEKCSTYESCSICPFFIDDTYCMFSKYSFPESWELERLIEE